MTSRYLLHIAYNGKNYHGWQKQHNALSVQHVIEEKLSLLQGENIETLGCGRTDTGVHAKSYYLHFDTRQEIDTDKFIFKLNQILPYDIAAYGISEVHAEFNARFDALWRTYEYCITTVKDPFLYDYAWYQYGQLDMEMMNDCAQKLIGSHDFECFSKVHTQVNNFVCEVTEAYWQRKNQTLIFTITANRFLRNMVRAVVGTLTDVGRGKITPQEFDEILQSKNRSEAGQSVPAHGLYLTRIQYK